MAALWTSGLSRKALGELRDHVHRPRELLDQRAAAAELEVGEVEARGDGTADEGELGSLAGEATEPRPRLHDVLYDLAVGNVRTDHRGLRAVIHELHDLCFF